MVQIIVNKQNNELAFRLERFNNLNQFDHLQRKKIIVDRTDGLELENS